MYNKVIIIGRLTRDVELRTTQSGTKVGNFTVACDRPKKKDGEKETDFINVVVWGSAAEFAEKYFHKGDACGVEGRLQVRNYEDKEGNKRTVTEVVAERMFFVGGKSSGAPANTTAPAASTAKHEPIEPLEAEDLPW